MGVNLKAVIMAGGSGERFWPLSTPERPKQFLRIFDDESLLLKSVTRLGDLVAPKDVYVITSRALTTATRRELPAVPKANVIGEPQGRDTGAAVALGVGVAGGADDDIIAFFPADHLIVDVPEFRRTLQKAIALARRVDTIVTIGIRPTRAATGFGYIDPKSGRFVEKPSAKRAADYLRRGYLWNAGMFIARAGVFRRAIAENAPALAALMSLKVSSARLAAAYAKLPRISFDYAVMEKLSRVEVVPGDFGWDDVGSFAAFDRHFAKDSGGNVRSGDTVAVDSTDCTLVARGARISVLGLKGIVVVTSGDDVLVVTKERAAELKRLLHPQLFG